MYFSVQVEPVAMLVRSVASSRPSPLLTSANAPPPSASSPAGSLTFHVDGRSKARSPAAVVYVVQGADGGALDALPVTLADADAVVVAGVVGVAVEEGADVVPCGGLDGPPQAMSSESEKSTAGTAAPGHTDRRMTASLEAVMVLQLWSRSAAAGRPHSRLAPNCCSS
ncbi:exported hypothetical protein [Arthrobacter sp. 9AX]|nr:exported hypothetical protein [Arthrobacter sp. 9AX]